MQVTWILAAVLLLGGSKEVERRFSDLEIDDDFRPYLTANALLMEVAGAKIVRDQKSGRNVVLAVASTPINDGSSKDRIRAEKVCRAKALASVVAERHGVQVARYERLKDQVTATIEHGEERATSVSELLQITETKVKGIARDMPVIGRWKSRDGDTFYLAIGVMLDESGEPTEAE